MRLYTGCALICDNRVTLFRSVLLTCSDRFCHDTSSYQLIVNTVQTISVLQSTSYEVPFSALLIKKKNSSQCLDKDDMTSPSKLSKVMWPTSYSIARPVFYWLFSKIANLQDINLKISRTLILIILLNFVKLALPRKCISKIGFSMCVFNLETGLTYFKLISCLLNPT